MLVPGTGGWTSWCFYSQPLPLSCSGQRNVTKSAANVFFQVGKACLESFPAEDALHILLQWLGLLFVQLNTQGRKAPEDRSNTAVHNGELFRQEERHLTEQRCSCQQAFFQLFARCFRSLGVRLCQDLVNQTAPVFLNSMNHQTTVGTGYRVHWQQRRMRKTL